MFTLEGIKGLGTTWWFEFFDCPIDGKEEMEQLVRSTITAFEDHYSRFHDGSLIGKINSGHPIANPTPELLELLTLGIHWHRKTGGVFDFLTAHHQEAQGYDSNYSLESTPLPPKTPLSALSLAPNISLKSGKIDLGGYGKGYLIDKLARLFRSAGCNEFLINGGGDIYVSSQEGNPVDIVLEHPEEPQSYIAKVPLQNMALGASSTYKRRWQSKTDGTQHTHLLGGSGGSASFVLHPSATTADILATLLAIDPEAAEPHLQSLPCMRLEGPRITHAQKFDSYLLHK